MSIIREFYQGELRPNEVNFKNPVYSSNFVCYEKTAEQLKKSLSNKQKKLLENIIGNFFNMEYEFGREMYTAGFAMGVKLTAESFYTKTH
ncbi:MAG: hypothetical protein J6B08_03215 [Ruminiclostridium sp.]|nr:hypothetical protein [Ruminiclostridium sp.]